MSKEQQQRALMELHYRTAQKNIQREFMIDHLREVDTTDLALEIERRKKLYKQK